MSFDIPVQYDAGGEMPDWLTKRIQDELAELDKEALTVTRVIVHADASPRYSIVFDKEAPMFQTRLALEKEHYDVGQKMGDSMLGFYATKRVEKSEGWKV